MTFSLKDLRHLELMARLKNREIKPQPLPSVLPVADKKSSSLTEKLLILSSELRAQGFETYATNLEEKLALFKHAANQDILYRTSLETGEDLIDQAHPDGDVEMGEASDHLGDVETQTSQHQKILEVVQQKMPRKVAQQAVFSIRNNLLQQFQYFYEYLQKILMEKVQLNKVPEAHPTIKSPQEERAIKGYWDTLIKYHDLGIKVFEGIKSFDEKASDRELLQFAGGLVRGIVATPMPLNTAEDFQKLLQELLNWVEDNNPIKRAKLIAKVKTAFKKESQFAEAFLLNTYKLIKSLKFTSQGVISNAQTLQENLAELIKEKPQFTQEYNRLNESLNGLMQQTDDFETNLETPTENDDPNDQKTQEKIGKIANYLSFIKEEIEPKLNRLRLQLKSFRRSDEQGLTNTTYRVFVSSVFMDTDKAVQGLTTSLNKMITTGTETIKNLGGENYGNVDRSPSFVATTKEKELQDLNSWKQSVINSQRSEPNKQLALKWINFQIEAVEKLQEDDLKGLQQVQKQNAQFKTDWKP